MRLVFIPDGFNVSSIKTAIVRTFLAAFVHTAWEELKYRNVSQLSSLARHNYQETKIPSM